MTDAREAGWKGMHKHNCTANGRGRTGGNELEGRSYRAFFYFRKRFILNYIIATTMGLRRW